ncbi:MAG: AAA family ATPase, partial [Bacilli bacterium]
ILSNSSSDKMTNIVNTIQGEQNEIIRNIVDKYLIVQGIAGSGKTSVALHRIAYLMYKERNLTSNNILIFSPNEVFSEYISNVLPELGENNVLQSTFSDFASSYIKEYKEVESFTAFIERFYKKEEIDGESFKVAKYKLSDEFKIYLDKYIGKLELSIFFSKGIVINTKQITKEKLNQLLTNRFSHFPLFSRLDAISEYLCDSINISYKKYGKTVKEKLSVLLNENLDIKSIYSKILSSEDFKKNAEITETLTLKIGKILRYEDLIPLMYLNFELNGYPNGNSIRHVIIDEAQDYSLLQFQMLKRIFNKSSFTILGDTHQTINPYYIYNNLNEVNSVFDDKGRYIELAKTYRSSEEIIDFTNQILG